MKKAFLSAVALIAAIGLAVVLIRSSSKILSPRDFALTSASSTAAFSLATTTVKISHSDTLATVDIEYPTISLLGISDGITEKMNAAIAADTIAAEKDFFTEVEGAQKGMASLPPEVPRDSEFYRRSQVFSSAKFGAVSVLYSDEKAFPGDAHPANTFDSAIYDAQTGGVIRPESIVLPGKLSELYARFVTLLGTKYGLTDDNYNLTPERLPQFSHLVIEDSGLHLYADQDSILAHVDGPADAILPWYFLNDISSPRFKN